MIALEAKVRCPNCHGRFFVPLAEVGRDNMTPCPNCGTSIRVKARSEEAAKPQPAPRAADEPERERPADVPVTVAADAAEPTPRPWWKFWAR